MYLRKAIFFKNHRGVVTPLSFVPSTLCMKTNMDKKDTDRETSEREDGFGGEETRTKRVAEKFKRKSSPLVKY